MNTVYRTQPIAHPSAWLGPQIAARESEWIYRLSGAELAEIGAAVEQVRRQGIPLEQMRQADFSLPNFGSRDRKSTRLNSSHLSVSRMPSSA